MPTTPSWQAARNGMPGNLDATNQVAQINQFLGTHAVTEVYAGNQLIDPGANSAAHYVWLSYGNNFDISQPFVMPTGQTAVGRVTIPVQPNGNAADLLVGLYPDNAGSPDLTSPLAQTLVPASWTTNLLAADGLENPPSALATAAYNSLAVDNIQSTAWTPPAFDQNGAASFPSYTVSGNYVIRVGGVDNSTAGYSTQVSLIPYQGGTIGMPIPSAALPQGTSRPSIAALPDAVVVTGGSISGGNTAATWVAQWDPASGSLGTWTQQAAFPISAYSMGMAANAATATVYAIGGNTSTTNTPVAQNTVYWAQVSNGQLGTWNTAAPYPFATWGTQAACLNGWLVAFGGVDNNRTTYSNVYYAKIFSDGSIGGWNTGPSLPITWGPGGFASFTTTANEIVIVGGNTSNGAAQTSLIQILPVTTSGLGTWRTTNWYTAQSNICAAFPSGAAGQYELFSFETSTYHSAQVLPVPLLSVPLPATGLTAGATYHVVIQQNQGPDPTSYLGIGIQAGALSGNALRRARFSGAWSAIFSGWSIPIAVYDQSPGGTALHAWLDPDTNRLAAAADTQVGDQTGRLLGYCEATLQPNVARNSNNLTTASTSPWTATNSTLTASTAQTHGGYAYSGLMTPNGTSAQAQITSEKVTVKPGDWYTVTSWLYSPTGYSTVDLAIAWYDSSGAFISSSNSTGALAAATWTSVKNVYQAVAGAAYAAIALVEGGTPSTSNTIYISNITLTSAFPTVLPSVTQVDYGQGMWPPTGVTQLA